MRSAGVSVTLLLLVTLLSEVTTLDDIYWEGQEDLTEFIEVPNGNSLGGHLRRIKRGFFDLWSSPFSSNTPSTAENLETATEDDDIAPGGADDETNTDGSGVPDNRVDTDLREKTLRVSFVVMEPYSMQYSNRDSVEFQNFSKDVADAVDLIFENVPGSQRASLVRIQSRLSDNFSCKVTLDIVTSGYDDTDKLSQILRDHIRNHHTLGHVLVNDADFSANVIDPGTTLETCDSDKIQCDDGTCIYETARCNGVVDCGDSSDEAGCPAPEQTNTTITENGNSYEQSPDDTYNTIDADDQETNYNPEESAPNGDGNYDPNSNTFGSDTLVGGNEPDSEGIDNTVQTGEENGADENNVGDNTANNGPERGDQPLEFGPQTDDEENTVRPTIRPIETNVCPDGEMVCDVTRCVPSTSICDNNPDCYDGSDEANCGSSKSCGDDDFRCNNGMCIPISSRCNSVSDCPNSEDELNCECREDEFRCADGTCIETRKRCDNYTHCWDGSDERDCTCSSDKWQCDHGSCIKRSKRCDGRVDCPTDRSDERNCFDKGYFRCKSGNYIPESKRCNRQYDCPTGDYSDEQNCPCGKGDFKCDNGYCIPAAKHCDRTHDCQDGSDERHCKYGTVCMAYQYECTSGKCVQSESRCNGTVECDDGSDEMNCPCKRGQFTCQNGSCINIAFRCDGRKDCRNGEDEYNCDNQACPTGTVQCDQGSFVHCAKPCDDNVECDNGEDEENCPGSCSHHCDGRCLEENLVCDGKPDCSDNSDETFCESCDGVNDFRCKDGDCINSANRCNGVADCRDGSDELECNITTIATPVGCSDNQFTCGDGACIDRQFVCDRHPDCFDNTDEDNCPCSDEDNFQCRSGACIPNDRVCDGRVDCEDLSDEENCADTPPPWVTYPYPNEPPTTQSVFTTTGPYGRPRQPDYSLVTPGSPDDRYPRPEQPQPEEPRWPGSPGGAGSDVNVGDYSAPGGTGESGPGGSYNGVDSTFGQPDSQGGTDSGPNSGYPNNQYPGGYPNRGPNVAGGQSGRGDDRYGGADSGPNSGYPNSQYPGGYPNGGPNVAGGQSGRGDDRYGGADSGPNSGYPNNQYPGGYPNRGPNVAGGQSGRGDGDRRPGGPRGSYPNVGDRDYLGMCAWYQWRCERGHCIDARRRCDGRVDCPYDVGDEFNCPNGSPEALKLTAYPDSQIVRYGGDVVFQCRDEGPLRAPVRWVREGGKPMKPGFYEKNGRLELIKVSMRDAGIYICQAPKYLGNPRAEIQVSLTVEPAKPTPPPVFGCKSNEATCANGQCIPKSALCDGRPDCSDNSDEDSCQHNGMCEPNEFECANHKCILKTWMCDSDDDCGDGSDEQNCNQPMPGTSCLRSEFACASQEQCIPKSFHCDGQADCMDDSDEFGCLPVRVSRPPSPSNLRLNPGDMLVLTCEAVGVPVPLISWRLNWGHVPPTCTSTSEDGRGTLTCMDMQPEHSGAYSCEAINNRGTSFAVPDAIVHVNKTDPCPPGYFNSEARSQSECIRCFCFGESSQCHSADLFTYNMPTPLGTGGTRLVGVTISPTGDVRTDSPINSNFDYQPLTNGAAITKVSGPSDWQGWSRRDAHPYVTLPETYNGNQLTSYGGKIRFSLASHAEYNAPDDAVPTIIIKGKYGLLFHTFRGVASGAIGLETTLTPGNWEKPGPRGFEQASREDIMMALDNIEVILLRGDLNNAGVNITDFAMESAQHINIGLGAASLVEECSCPPGYEGLSCEKCAAGYVREKSGPWLGNCVKASCPAGTYGDPSSGYACRPCPCPLTNRENQFARTCALGQNGQVVCDCNPGYEGTHCEVCAPGYIGNPMLRGDSCQPAPQDNCNKIGTRQVKFVDECECKDNVQGRYCDQCKNDSFYLSNDFRHGCALCFCSGVTQQCRSSNLRRKTTYIQFNVPQIVQDVKLYSSSPADPYGAVRYTSASETDAQPELYRSSLVVRNYPRSGQSVYYWSLPNSFSGDKVTSYGGYLRYTLQGVPQSASSSNSRNDPDVQIISYNHLTFHYVGQFTSDYEGTLNASVQLLETGWQRADGKEVSREHFLLALADVKTILIKASYSPDAQLATPLSASIETADENGNGPLALHVEQCVCPEGYIGSSCEDCAPGYTRSSSGLYLEHCDLCDCNGHSKMCNPESGVCYDCEDNTDGDHCETCKPGYQLDYYGNCIRIPSVDQTYCQCNESGMEPSTQCDANGNCVCKANVQGSSCDTCRPGTFGLDAENPQGCLSCYCSGVTNQCHEGSHFTRIPIAAPIFDTDFGGYTLMDLNAETVLHDQFVPIPDKSELTYVFSYQPNMELYWSLPVFPGNRVLSYNGMLSLKQEFRSDHSISSEPGTDIVLVGDFISIYWTNPEPLRSAEPKAYRVPLRENGWYVLNTASPVSRSQFMQVLKNLRRVLVRATLVREILSTTIADVSMDTATENFNGAPQAKGVEVCMCPPGYTGTSCESCSAQYYKDANGNCKQCPCNGNDCQLDSYGNVKCNCQPPYTGPDCTTIGLVMELHPTIHDSGNGSLRQVTLTCKYRAPEPLTITFFHKNKQQWPPKYYNESVFDKDGWHDEHVLQTVWDTRDQGEIYECHTVSLKGLTLGVLTTSLPESVGAEPQTTTLSPSNVPTSSIVVKITSQTIKIQDVGSSVNFTCVAQSSMTRNRLQIRWSKVDGELPQGRYYVDPSGILVLTQLQEPDSGQYKCEASDGLSTGQAIATLQVPGNGWRPPVASVRPNIFDGFVGDRFELTCDVSGNPTPMISWQRGANQPLPQYSQQYDNMFIIENAQEEDSGEYRCIASNSLSRTYSTAVITIRRKPYEPNDSLKISPSAPTVYEGQSLNIVCTATSSVPAGSLEWSRQDGSQLLANARSDNGVLYIDNARAVNQGVYTCQSVSSNVTPVSVVVTIIPTGTPPPSENPKVTVSVDNLKIPTGGSGTVDCNPSGSPLPVIRWTKYDGNFGPGTSQRDNTLIVSRATDDDEGYYLCEGTVDGVPVASVYVNVEIEKREPPRVEIWPSGEQSVPLGNQYEMQCRVTAGIPDPDIMWSRSGGRPLSRHVQILPQNILRFEKVEVNDEGEYTCSASNVAGADSASAVIKVRSPPEITITPSNYVNCQSEDQVVVECRANGYPEPLVSIKSNRNQRELVAPALGYVALRIPSASYSDEGEYTCVATSAAGTIEEPFYITVNDRGDVGPVNVPDESGSGEYDIGQDGYTTPFYDPDYLPAPNSLIAPEGQSEISINCQGPPEYEIQWHRADNRPLQRNAEQQGTRLIIHNVTIEDSGDYICNLYNRQIGDVQQAAHTRLVVKSAPRVSLRPPTQTVHPGDSPTVECVVEGDNIIDVIWRPLRGPLSNRVEIRGNTLIFHNIEVEDTGTYECIARNDVANTTGVAEVMVSEETDRESESHDHEQFAHTGAAVHLSCNVTQPNLSITWTKDGRSIPRSVIRKQDGSLYIRMAQKSDSGHYVCLIRNQYGTQASNYINLHIKVPHGLQTTENVCKENQVLCDDKSSCLEIGQICDNVQHCRDGSDERNCYIRDKRHRLSAGQGASQLVSIDQPRRPFRVGENVNVLCRSQSRNVNVKWEKYGTQEYVDVRTYGDGAMLIVDNVQGADAGIYRCIGSNEYDTSYEDFLLEVEGGAPDVGPAPYPDQNSGLPRDRYVARLSDSVDMPCRHDLEPPYNIEWSKEFSVLPSEVRTNQPILRLERVTEADSGIYICRVSNNRATVEARAVLQVVGVVPSFRGQSWLSLPALKDAYMQFDIEISFKPSDSNGLILYNSQNQGREGDYVALQLEDGVPQFIVDDGTGPLEVKGDHPLQLNTWHTVRLSRTNSRITMYVDQSGPFVAELNIPIMQAVLELKQPLYIGGVPDRDQLPDTLAYTNGFVGCVSMLVLGREEKNIMLDSLEKYQISECDSCSPNRCLNDGLCQEYLNELGYICICAPGYAGQNCSRTGEACRIGLCGPGKCTDTADGYKCACPVTHSGRNCESKQNIEYPAFRGSAYFAIKPPETSRSLKMSLKVKAMSPVTDGIIMYCAESSRGDGGFTSLTIHNGKLEFIYDLGKGGRPVILTSNRTLLPNEWSDINIARVGALVSLKINANQNYEQTLDSPTSVLNLETPMYLGGVDESSVLNKNIGVTTGFSGCIKDIKRHGVAVDFMNSSILSVNVQDCQHPQRGDIPESDGNCQCKNGGVCTLDYSACSCPTGFTGRLCESRSSYPLQKPSSPSNPCVFHPCRNGGTCRYDPTSKLNHTCDCSLGYAGVFCQMSLELLQSVGFNGNGYLELRHDLLRYDDLSRDPAVIALAIHTTSDGILLFQREMESSPYNGDYILLRVERGFVVLDWDFGSGLSTLTIDNVYVNDGERHQIIAKILDDRMVSLSVDGYSKTGKTTGISSVMNADSNIYIGGMPDHYNVERYPGLNGCIEQVELMSVNRGLPLGQVAVAGRNTQRCKEYY